MECIAVVLMNLDQKALMNRRIAATFYDSRSVDSIADESRL